jgi:hypothetical protein
MVAVQLLAGTEEYIVDCNDKSSKGQRKIDR